MARLSRILSVLIALTGIIFTGVIVALATYCSIALNAFNEVESALTNETLLLEREGFLADSVGNNESALEITPIQYDVGQVDILSVLQL